MKKKILASLLAKDNQTKALLAQLATYGLEPAVHTWQNDNQKMAWMGVKDVLAEPSTAAWIIAGTAQQLADADTRYGLSMVALSLLASKKPATPIIIVQTGQEAIKPETLPTALGHATVVALQEATPAKMVAKAHSPVRLPEPEWFLEMVGDDKLGQWFALRPAAATWQGVIFGVQEAEITFQAVGPAGGLPDKATLNYPMQGLKLNLGPKEYTAWALRNPVDPGQAYYVKVVGFPSSLVFGPYAEDEAAEMYVVNLT